MTEKRFTHKKWYDDRQLFDGDEPFAIVDVYIQAEEICNKLNELHEEKEELKLDNELLLTEMKEIRDKLTIYLQVKGYE